MSFQKHFRANTVNDNMGVVNISSGFKVKNQEYYEMRKGIEKLLSNGTCVVVAAGNYGPVIDTMSKIALIPGVISVGSTNIEGNKLSSFSSRGLPGSLTNRPTIVAPGEQLIELKEDDDPKVYYSSKDEIEKDWYVYHNERINISEEDIVKYKYISGTSFSTSGICGLITVMALIRRQLGLTMTPSIARDILAEMATPITGYSGHEVGFGLVTSKHFDKYIDKISSGIIPHTHWAPYCNVRELFDDTVKRERVRKKVELLRLIREGSV